MGFKCDEEISGLLSDADVSCARLVLRWSFGTFDWWPVPGPACVELMLLLRDRHVWSPKEPHGVLVAHLRGDRAKVARYGFATAAAAIAAAKSLVNDLRIDAPKGPEAYAATVAAWLRDFGL